MKLVIDRARWARGGKSLLLDQHTGNMCCLGFFALQGCGAERCGIVEREGPYCSKDRVTWPKWMFELADPESDRRRKWEDVLMETNDHVAMNDKEREEAIRATFARHDVEVEFVG